MNIKVTIEVEGTSEEVSAWLARLPAVESRGVGGAHARAITQSEWTDEQARIYLDRISPKAGKLVIAIAERAPEAEFDDLQEELGLDGYGLGGVMASVGFARGAGYPEPFERDRQARVYRMDPKVAAVFLRVAPEFS